MGRPFVSFIKQIQSMRDSELKSPKFIKARMITKLNLINFNYKKVQTILEASFLKTKFI
jgi:hypothetical protein